MSKRNYATVNPCVMCEPMGSVLAFKGIEDTMVLFHGSQGCSTYMRLHLAHHFREPVDIASSSLSEHGAVYGGSTNLKKGLTNVMTRYDPKVIGVATTCLAETIGEDVNGIINEYREEGGIPDDVIVIPVSTPSYAGSHTNGYIKAVDAIVRHFTQDAQDTMATHEMQDIQDTQEGGKVPNNKVNVILAETISPADIRELKQIISDTVGSNIFLPDISDTFDAPMRDIMPKISPGGTPLTDIADMVNSTATIGLGTSSANLAMEYLSNDHSVPSYSLPMPIGLKNCDKFIQALTQVAGCEISDKYRNERGRLMDAMIDVHKYTYGVRVALFGDPDTVLGLLSLTLEIGMHPVLVASGSKTVGFSECVRTRIEKVHPDCESTILEGVDFDMFNDAVKNAKPDLLIGNSNGKYISEAEKIPLVRVGFPIHDRVGAQRILIVGYRGAMELIDRVTNTILETEEIARTRENKVCAGEYLCAE